MGVNLNNYGSFTTSLRSLLVAAKDNPTLLPDISAELTTLETALSAIEDAKTRQQTHKWNKQAATQDLKAALITAQTAAIQIQSAAKFKLGPRNEVLTAFQVKPLRKHGPRKATLLKAQEEALKQQETELLRGENDLLKKKLVEKQDGPAAAS